MTEYEKIIKQEEDKMVLLAGSDFFTGNCLLTIPLLEKEITGNYEIICEEENIGISWRCCW